MTTPAYTWCAVYGDNTALEEQDAPNFASVDQSRVKSLFLLGSDYQHVHRVSIPDSAQAVFFRRSSTEIKLTDGSETERSVVHCIGWSLGDEGVYLFLGNDGSSLLTTDLQAV